MKTATLMIAAMLSPAAAPAQEGPEWELQRCVWGCLANFGPADNPAYQACVAARCSEPPARPWAGGATSDGRGHWAGARSADGTVDLLVICGPGGQRFLQVAGPEGGTEPADITFVIDGAVRAVRFQQMAGTRATAALPKDAAVIDELMRGRALWLRNSAGYELGQFDLAGAGTAISAALAACR